MALIELVDFNDALLLANADKPAKTRRSRRGGKKADGTSESDAPVKAKAENTIVAEDEEPEAPKASSEDSPEDAKSE